MFDLLMKNSVIVVKAASVLNYCAIAFCGLGYHLILVSKIVSNLCLL